MVEVVGCVVVVVGGAVAGGVVTGGVVTGGGTVVGAVGGGAGAIGVLEITFAGVPPNT